MYKLYKNFIITKVAQLDMETFYSKLANQKCLKIIQKTIFELFSSKKVSFIILETFD